MKYLIPFSLFLFSALIIVSSGCSTNSTESVTTEPTGDHLNHNDHGNHDHSSHNNNGSTNMKLMKIELAKLSPEDAASAEEQHICPVTGEMLGTMGPPKKIDANGEQVWICCDGCKEKLLASPDQYLSKLKTK